jgi:hypothetical protein
MGIGRDSASAASLRPAPVFAAIAENVVRLETMSPNAGGVSAVAPRSATNTHEES